MLNQSRVLHYIKAELGFPFHLIEYTDEQILEYITTYTIREFSYYIPDTVSIAYNVQLAANKVPGKANEFYIQDDQGLEILNVSNIFFSQSNLLLAGHPPLGPMNFGEIRSWILDVEMAGMLKQYSNWNFTFEFKHPNIVRISPNPTSEEWIVIEYERMHPPDLSKVPNDLQMIFCQLATADIMILLGRIRKKYEGNLKTPFGDIPISAEVGDEGKEKKTAILEKLQGGIMTNIVFSVG